jgi:hypothetical protein
MKDNKPKPGPDGCIHIFIDEKILAKIVTQRLAEMRKGEGEIR